MYFTIQFKHPHRGSINHQSITDKKGNSNLVVSLVFKGYLKKTRVVVGSWVVEGAIRNLDKGVEGKERWAGTQNISEREKIC